MAAQYTGLKTQEYQCNLSAIFIGRNQNSIYNIAFVKVKPCPAEWRSVDVSHCTVLQVNSYSTALGTSITYMKKLQWEYSGK